ncbi:MAG: hypothetical protein BWY83_00544 [bacterium ADurb.Bin478]|nr:MAG: hypothetical protein BWY83_00544 [bacterium ADurb.Bin478]
MRVTPVRDGHEAFIVAGGRHGFSWRQCDHSHVTGLHKGVANAHAPALPAGGGASRAAHVAGQVDQEIAISRRSQSIPGLVHGIALGDAAEIERHARFAQSDAVALQVNGAVIDFAQQARQFRRRGQRQIFRAAESVALHQHADGDIKQSCRKPADLQSLGQDRGCFRRHTGPAGAGAGVDPADVAGAAIHVADRIDQRHALHRLIQDLLPPRLHPIRIKYFHGYIGVHEDERFFQRLIRGGVARDQQGEGEDRRDSQDRGNRSGPNFLE